MSRTVGALAVLLMIAIVSIAVLTTLLLTEGETRTTQGQTEPTATSQVTANPRPPEPTTTPFGARAAESFQSTPTATPTAPPTVVEATATTAEPTPMPPPTVAPTAAVRYASIEGRPFYDAYTTARDAVENLGVATYEEALTSPNFAILARAAAGSANALSSFVGNLPYDDACRRTLAGIGGRGFQYWWGLADAVSPSPFGSRPMGPATWNSAISLWQAQLVQLEKEATATCGY